MKVAVSIPDAVFAAADALAKQLRTSRSDLYARAVSAYVDKHSDEQITAAINAVVDEVGDEPDPFLERARRRIFDQVEW